MFNNKKVLILLLVLLFALIGASNVFAQEEADFGAVFGFQMGLEAGLVLNGEEDDQVFNFGIISRAFQDQFGFPKESLYLFLYFNIYDGDFDTGEGAIVGYTWFNVQRGLANSHPMGPYVPALFVFFDFFGSGNNLFIYFAEPYVKERPGGIYAHSGYFYAIAEFDLGMGYFDFLVIDYQNDGINESPGNDFFTDPRDLPSEYSPATCSTTFYIAGLYDLDFSPLTLDFDIGFTHNKSLFLNVDEDINGGYFSPSYGGFTDDEIAFYRGRYEIGVSFAVTYTIENIGSFSFEPNINYKFGVNYYDASLELNALIDQFSEDIMLEFGVIWTAVYRDWGYIEGETETLQVQYLPFRSKRFEISLDASYRLDMGIGVTPNLSILVDLADLQLFNVDPEPWDWQSINPDPHNYEDIRIPYSFKLGVDLGVGGGGVILVPVYIRLTNIPTQKWYEWLDAPYNNQLREIQGSIDLMKLFFGVGIQCEF
jgi:hypothetical protein